MCSYSLYLVHNKKHQRLWDGVSAFAQKSQPTIRRYFCCWVMPLVRCGHSCAHLNLAEASVAVQLWHRRLYKDSGHLPIWVGKSLAGTCNTKASGSATCWKKRQKENYCEELQRVAWSLHFPNLLFFQPFFWKYMCLTANERSGSTEFLNFFPQGRRRIFFFNVCVSLSSWSWSCFSSQNVTI